MLMIICNFTKYFHIHSHKIDSELSQDELDLFLKKSSKIHGKLMEELMQHMPKILALLQKKENSEILSSIIGDMSQNKPINKEKLVELLKILSQDPHIAQIIKKNITTLGT